MRRFLMAAALGTTMIVSACQGTAMNTGQIAQIDVQVAANDVRLEQIAEAMANPETTPAQMQALVNERNAINLSNAEMDELRKYYQAENDRIDRENAEDKALASGLLEIALAAVGGGAFIKFGPNILSLLGRFTRRTP